MITHFIGEMKTSKQQLTTAIVFSLGIEPIKLYVTRAATLLRFIGSKYSIITTVTYQC